MFCPPGYVPLSLAWRGVPPKVYQAAEQWLRGMQKAAYEGESHALGLFFWGGVSDLLEQHLMGGLTGRMFIASPTGIVQRLDQNALLHSISGGGFHLSDFERLERKQFKEVIDDGMLFDFPASDFLEEFKNPNLQWEGETIWDFAKHLNLDLKFMRDGLWYERQGYTISFRTWEKIAALDYIELDVMARLVLRMRPFEGWALCISEETFSNDWAEIWNAFLGGDEARNERVSADLLRLPTVADERRASVQFIAMYDRDDQVTKATCRGQVSLGTRAFGRAWEMAKLQRPGLGEGGRPRLKT